MIPLRLAAAARPLAMRARMFPAVATRSFIVGVDPKPLLDPLSAEHYPSHNDVTDPDQNGGYVNPPFEKRQFRDPYGDWWDKQERRNFGEALHEDNDLVGRMTPEVYDWTTPGKGLVLIGTFAGVVFSLMGVVYAFYPDKPSVPRTFPHGGLERALGGPKALLAVPEGAY